MLRFLGTLTGRTAILAIATATVFFAPVSGLKAADTPLDEANLAWQRGDYVGALTIYSKLLTSSDAESVLEPIALQTGELFKTIELTTDGASPQFSPDGRHLAYEQGTGLDRVTRLLTADGSTKPLTELRGSGAAFSPDGTSWRTSSSRHRRR